MKYIIHDIERAVCLRFKLTPAQLRAPDRSRRIVRPRQIAMFLARELTNASYPKIGQHFNRDHATVIAGRRRITILMQDPRGFMLADVASVREVLAGLTPYKVFARAAAAVALVTTKYPINASISGLNCTETIHG